MPAPTVTLVLKGLMAIFVNEAETECTVGILKDPPPRHSLEIFFRKTPVGGMTTELRPSLKPPQIKKSLRLEAENVSQTKITFLDRNANINRQAEALPENKEAFRWVVDLEHAELYDSRIGAKKNAFNPFLTFKKGELYTKNISRSRLFTQRGLFLFEEFGFVANAIGARIRLDQPNSSAVFYNGGDAISLSEPNTDYEIEINHDAENHSEVVTDANHYYKAVGLGLPEAERILFMSRAVVGGGPPAGPEAACFTAFLGRSQPGE